MFNVKCYRKTCLWSSLEAVLLLQNNIEIESAVLKLLMLLPQLCNNILIIVGGGGGWEEEYHQTNRSQIQKKGSDGKTMFLFALSVSEPWTETTGLKGMFCKNVMLKYSHNQIKRILFVTFHHSAKLSMYRKRLSHTKQRK